MSKSIKQYKDAMDNIRISDSFLKRTENLLKELPENETVTVTGRKQHGIKHITLAAGIGAAACIALVATMSPAAVRDDISTDTDYTEAVTVTEVTAANETVYIEIESDRQIIIPAADAELLEKEPADEAVTTVSVQITTAAEKTETHLQKTEPPVTAVQSTAAAEESVEAVSASADEPQIRRLYDIDYSNAEVEVVAYINSSEAFFVSTGSDAGEDVPDSDEEGAAYGSKTTDLAILDDRAAENLITRIADIVYASSQSDGGADCPVVFSVSVNDAFTGRKAYSITLNENHTVNITLFNERDSITKSYFLSAEDFTAVEKELFLCFGTEAEYRDYLGLTSGK